jgi:hypothetical protein
MTELSIRKKNRIRLEDYSFEEDIATRHTLTKLSPIAPALIDEILFSKKIIPIELLAHSLNSTKADILPILEKLQTLGLLDIQGEQIETSKEAKKYYEVEIQRFQEDFTPDLNFFQGLLKKVSIHHLPLWYLIPKSSNHIFGSIVEKYLQTPQTYLKHLAELKTDPIIDLILNKLFESKEFSVSTDSLMKECGISREEFSEYLLLLEFHFACFVQYKKDDSGWVETLVPLYEWKEYLLKKRKYQNELQEDKVLPQSKEPFDFAKKIHHFLQNPNAKDPTSTAALKLQFIDREMTITPLGQKCLALEPEAIAFFIFQHRTTLLSHLEISERVMCEVERAIGSLTGWVLFENFLYFSEVSLSDDTRTSLVNRGRLWRYQFPNYADYQKEFIETIVFKTLYMSGMVILGKYQGKDCFKLSSFGRRVLC